MHELNRLAYLQAIGIDNYVSRGPLAGAAASQRLLVRARVPSATVLPDIQPEPARASIAPLPRPEVAKAPPPRQAPRPEPVSAIGRFSLAALVAGPYLWLEDLAGSPLAREQVHLVQAMALAVAGQAVKADVAQFDWPLHSNRQLDLSEEAASAALGGFLGRRLEQFACSGLILLGSAASARLGEMQLPVKQVRCAYGSAQMLADPSLKREVWRVLAPLRRA